MVICLHTEGPQHQTQQTQRLVSVNPNPHMLALLEGTQQA